MKSKLLIAFCISAAISIFAMPAISFAADGGTLAANTALTASASASTAESAPTLVTAATKTVKNPFKLGAVSASKKVYRAGGTITIQMKVKGAVPRECMVYFTDGRGWGADIRRNAKTGLYEFKWDVTNATELGKYKVDSIVLTDARGYEFTFYNNKLHKGSGKAYVNMSKAAFTVKKGNVKYPFKMSSVSASKKVYRTGSTIAIRMKVAGSVPRSCMVNFTDGTGWGSSIRYNEKTKLYEFKWAVTNTTERGKYKVDSIVLTDAKGRKFEFSNSKLHKGSGRAYVDLSKAGFTVK